MADETTTAVPVEAEPEFNYDVVEEGQVEDKTLDIEAQMAELTAENERLVKAQDAAPQQLTADTLAAAFAQAQTKPTKAPAPKAGMTQEQLSELMTKVNTNFYDNPAGKTVELLTPILTDLNDRNQAQVNQQALTISKLMVLNDDTSKSIYSKYKEEVETIVGSLPPTEGAYSEAIGKVKANHFDELVAESVEAQVEALVAKALEGKGVAQKPQFTNANSPASAPPSDAVERIKVTPNGLANAQAWALTKGYNWADSEDRDWVVKYLKGRGMIK